MTIHLPPDGRLRAITVREPFATLIAMGIKSVENRVLPVGKDTVFPMTVAVHASSDESQMTDDCNELCKDSFIFEVFDEMDGEVGVPGRDIFYCQNIVGLVDIVACVSIHDMTDEEIAATLAPYEHLCPQTKPRNSYEEWANGPWCYLFANPRRFKTGILARGQLGLWRLTDEQQTLAVKHSQELLLDPKVIPTMPVGGVAKTAGKAKAAV